MDTTNTTPMTRCTWCDGNGGSCSWCGGSGYLDPHAAQLCDACHSRPAGHGHFALYCLPCSELPYGVHA